MEHVLSHFKSADTAIHQLLVVHHIQPLQANLDPTTYLYHLNREIIGQQLSVKVARVIFERFWQLVSAGTTDPTITQPVTRHTFQPYHLLRLEDEELRGVGISVAKIKYLKDLATKVESGQLDLASLASLPEAEVITQLTQVKGIGQWTAEMFLMFVLGREDVFSVGDLGLRRAMEKLYRLPKDSPVTAFQPLVAHWQPYRTYAALALWESLDNAPQVIPSAELP